MLVFFWILFAYACGSVPFGLIITRFSGGGDIRSLGSGNIGATNVLRTGKKWAAALTLLFDGLKGFFPVFLASFFAQDLCISLAFISILGHIFPVWLKFKGGKGVATALGTYLALHFWLGLCIIAVWILVVRFWRISSMGALVAFSVAPIIALAFTGFGDLFDFSLLVALLIGFTHRTNLQRLLSGTEGTISPKP
jgi:glycerol-3-phosphate acyltransferase PlsY